jgi:hypothetical protein
MRPLAEDEFAIRFTERELEGLFAREVQVGEGSVGLLFLDGRLDQQQLPPGKRRLTSFWQGLLHRGPKKEVVLVRSSEVALKFTLPNLLTADPLFLNWECDVVLQLHRGAEQLFYTNLMRERDRFTLLDLRPLVYPSLRDAASVWFGERTLENLVASPSLEDLALSAEKAVCRGLLGKGITLLRVEPRQPSCAAWDDKTRNLAEGLQQVWKEEGELERRKKFAEVKQAVELQEVEAETAGLATFTKRADLWERLRQAFNTAEMSRLGDERGLEDFVRQMDREKLLNEDDFERLKRTLREKQEDEGKARSHLVRTAELERDYDYKMLELRQRRGLTTAELEFQQELERQRLQGRYEGERASLDFQLEKARKEAERVAAAREVEGASRRAAQLEDARTQAQTRGLEREARRLDDELRLALEEKRRSQERLDRAELDRQELDRKTGELELELKQQRELQDLEIKHLEALKDKPVGVLIATSSDPGKASLLARLEELKIMKDMPLEHVLVLAAEKSPQAAAQLGQILRKTMSEEEKRLYERIINEQQGFQGKQQETYRENLDRFERMMGTALDAQKEIVKALAPERRAPAPSTATPGQAVSALVCPQCRVARPGDANYCPNCGGSLRLGLARWRRPWDGGRGGLGGLC